MYKINAIISYSKISSYIFVILAFWTANVKLIVRPLSDEQGKLRYSLIQCVMSAAKEFDYSDIITLSLATKDFSKYSNSTTATDKILLEALYQQLNWTILVTKSDRRDRPESLFKKSDNYIIQFRDSDEFSSILNFLKNRKSWNPHARFIVLTSTVFSDPVPTVGSIVEHLWHSRVLNAIIMVPEKKSSSKIIIYSWFPFSDTHCGDGFDETDIINVCKYGQFLYNDSLLFPDKIPKNMNGCVVKIRAVIWPPYIIEPKKISHRHNVKFTKGIEILLMNTMAEIANFTPVYSISWKEQDWGHIAKNKSASGMMRTLLKEEVDIGMGGLASLQHRHFHFDASESYLKESTTWCVPRARPTPKWQCLLIIFHFSTWVSIIISYIFVSLGVKLLSFNQFEEFMSYRNTVSIFQNVYSIMLGITVKTLPKGTKLRLVLILWTSICLTLNSAYQSSLISFLTQPSYQKQIDTFAEMLDVGYEFGLVPPTFKFIRNPDNDSSSYHLTSWVTCDDVKKCLDRTAYQRDFAVGVPRMYMIYTSDIYTDKKGDDLLHWSTHDIVSYPIEMIMIKGYPLHKRINQLIFHIKEAGLVAKWIEEFMRKPVKKVVENENNENEIILTKKHLEGSFTILGIGLALATIVFILELLYQW